MTTETTTGTPVLKIDNVTMQFGGVTALNQADFAIQEGEIFALIGPNGAGKTTVFNVVTGVYKPTKGRILFQDKRIDGQKRFKIAKGGIARTFQNIRLFHNMSALENVMVGADCHHKTGAVNAVFGFPVISRHYKEEKQGRELAHEMLNFVGIDKHASATAKNLAYGDQRRLEIARALATKPKLLLLDEPAAGMNPKEKEDLQGLIRRIRDTGVTVLLIEHDMGLVMHISDRVSVLDFGQLIASGTPAEVQNNERVIQAYLGVASDAS